MSDDGDVIEFKPRERGPHDSPVRSRTARYRTCLHRHVSLDHKQTKVFCDDCGAEVLAFDALAMFAREYERWVIAHDNAKREYEQRAKELAEIKRELRNAKSRLRRRRAEATA